jgi:cytochrome c oxidase assembly protein subunit 15
MPFDARHFPNLPPRHDPRLSGRRRVGLWLLSVCFMVWVMVILGGVTRLTGSGLSIMEWAPLSGVLPPLSEAEWQRLFALYQTIPQYQLLHDGFGLDGFKQIFWLEWTHRLWGRLIGVAVLGPLAWFAWQRMITLGLALRLLGLVALGAVQGAIGWFMVASGFFPDSVAVSAVRLTVHLGFALLLLALLLWLALTELQARRAIVPRWMRVCALVWAGLVALTILAGGLVAGNHAGLAYNTFPLMDGALVPAAYGALTPFWHNLTANIAAVQFDHRLLATLSGAAAIVMAGLFWRIVALRPVVIALTAAICVQYTLGVATLLLAVPVGLAASHQAVAVLVLGAAIWLVYATQTEIKDR